MLTGAVVLSLFLAGPWRPAMAPIHALEWVQPPEKELRGRVVLLEKWPTLAEPSERHLRELNDLHARYAGAGLRIVAVTSAKRDEIDRFVAQHGVGYSVARVHGSRVGDVQLIDPAGGVAWEGHEMYLGPRHVEWLLPAEVKTDRAYWRRQSAWALRVGREDLAVAAFERIGADASAVRASRGFAAWQEKNPQRVVEKYVGTGAAVAAQRRLEEQRRAREPLPHIVPRRIGTKRGFADPGPRLPVNPKLSAASKLRSQFWVTRLEFTRDGLWVPLKRVCKVERGGRPAANLLRGVYCLHTRELKDQGRWPKFTSPFTVSGWAKPVLQESSVTVTKREVTVRFTFRNLGDGDFESGHLVSTAQRVGAGGGPKFEGRRFANLDAVLAGRVFTHEIVWPWKAGPGTFYFTVMLKDRILDTRTENFTVFPKGR